MTQGIYAYGVIEQEPIEFEVDGVEGAERVYTVDHRTLSAIVSDIDTLEPEETDGNARAHDRVLGRLLDHDGGRTVVPMQFGMAFKGKRTLKNVLRGARPAFTRTLREIDGTVEVGLKLVVEEGAAVDRSAVRRAVADRLDPIVESSVENDLFSDRLILNRSYLLDRDRRSDFDEAVESIDEEFPEIMAQYSGPWAPYNFVDIEIGGRR